MLRILAAATLALTLPLTAFAQSGGIDQIKAEIMNDPAMMGMEIDLDSLTDEQIVQISEVLSSDDSEAMKQQKVTEITGQ